MEQYHGTDKKNALDIINGKLSVSKGGGELGQGFYAGDINYEAHNWAWHKYGKEKAVVNIQIDDDDFLKLDPLCLDTVQTRYRRLYIKRRKVTRSYLFNRNVVWAPVVGKIFYNNFQQIKYEGEYSEKALNSSVVIKTIV